MNITFFKKVAIVWLAGLVLFSCATVPVSGRKQLNLVSNEEILPMSFAQYTEVLKESKLSNNAEWTQMVKRAGSKIQAAVEQYMKEKAMRIISTGISGNLT